MRGTEENMRRARPATPPGNEQLLRRLAQALDSGLVAAEDVERLLSRGRRRAPGRPTAAGVLYALGSVVVFCGLAIAYGTVFDDLPWAAQITTPYLFPLVALGGCIWLSRRGFAWWQTDLAGLVGYVALGIAFAVSGSASGWMDTGRQVAAGVALAALVAVAIVGAVSRATRSPRLLWVGMPAALAALGIAAAYLAGLWEADLEGPVRLGWVILAEAGAAAAVAVILARRDRSACLYLTLWATVGGYAAVMFCGDDLTQFSVWHLILAGVVVAAFLAAAALDFDALIWIAAGGGAVWVLMIAVVVGSATGAALAVVLAGIGLVGLGVLVARLRRAPRITRT
jgi:hypothetical protein